MTVFQWALSAGLAVAGIGAATAAALLRSSRQRAAEQNATAEERAALALQRRNTWQRRLAVIALGIGCLMMFVLAGIAAWLSFGAQREYAHAHNGGDWDAATGFALLLDAGALSLSLIRFFEALTLRSSAITRILLLAFVSASAAMNLLHAPGSGAGSAFLAVVPPLVYAILLEMLLFKIEQVIMGRQKRRKAARERAYSLLLWLPWPIGAPVKMWKAWRSELLATVDNVRVIGSQRPRPSAGLAEAPVEMTVERADSTTVPGPAKADAASVNALPPSVPAAAEKPEEPPVAAVAPPAAAAAVPAITPTPTPEAEAEPVKVNEARVPNPVAEPDPAAVPEPEEEPEPAPEPEAVPEPEPETADEREREEEPAAAGEPVMEKQSAEDDEPAPEDEEEEEEEEREDEEEPDPQHSTPPDGEEGEDEEARERLRIDIDLSVLPANLSQRQKAERIYVAHQAAGVALSQADLGKWAGYKNPNSGGNEYRRLEREHGPIVVREGATHVDLNWSHQPVAA
ncbi:DUF2637 domain-containing protein [Streptomyces sp. H036]|uniref:DUF2637 domain-containing protein n=1 Tax=Streptomyces sp. H036 TaxID=1519487 RepID=UPI0006AE2DB4|nr:DUF2637 domain-containing protein [Streptomyces sp. H036]KOV48715.1 hypothetical protein ADK98_09725 [Streptomyces sp. H036]